MCLFVFPLVGFKRNLSLLEICSFLSMVLAKWKFAMLTDQLTLSECRAQGIPSSPECLAVRSSWPQRGAKSAAHPVQADRNPGCPKCCKEPGLWLVHLQNVGHKMSLGVLKDWDASRGGRLLRELTFSCKPHIPQPHLGLRARRAKQLFGQRVRALAKLGPIGFSNHGFNMCVSEQSQNCDV